MPGLARRQAGTTSALLVVRASEHLDLAPVATGGYSARSGSARSSGRTR